MSDGCGGVLSFRVLSFESLDSTNEEARRQVGAGADAGTVIWARQQQAGRGRRGRAWVSDEGNLFCSVIVRPGCSPARAAQVSLVTALAVADAVEAALGGRVAVEGEAALGGRVAVEGEAALGGRAAVEVKWPNDVLVGGRKIAGILLESDMAPGAGGAGLVASLVVGVGINVAGAPEGTEFPATSLAHEGAEDLAVAGVLARFLARFGYWYRRWAVEGLAVVREAWLARAAGLGGPVTVRLHRETLWGTFVGLDGDGALLLASGGEWSVRSIAAGDVFFGGVPVPSFSS